MKDYFINNFPTLLGLFGTLIAFGYTILRKFWTIEKDINDLKNRLSKQEENYKEVFSEIKQELREIRSDIKLLLSQGTK